MTARSVLIAGAGPTGLVLALGLARRGATLRIISDAAGPGEHSRAMGVQARTLEFYRQFGFADEVVAQGVPTRRVHLREAEGGGREVLTANIEGFGRGVSPYPFVLAYPQDDHERLLVSKLEAEGVRIEWGAKLTGFTQDEGGVRASIDHAGGDSEEAEFDYLCGCDGAHSQVRRTLALGFPGGTYEQLFYVADAKIEGGFKPDMYMNLGRSILALMLPVRSSGMQRLVGLVPPSLSHRDDLTYEDIRADVEPVLGVHATEINWFSAYRVHHRVAERFRVGRAFLLGDAGHIHSPAGGQGMNTGIGDAVNLGWKLADVQAGRADPSLLDSYEPERIGFARKLVATTDRGFKQMTAGGFRGALIRRFLAPLAATVATRFDASRRTLFRLVSQTHVGYRRSKLSEGTAGRIRGGDRLPWTGAEGEDNFAPLRSCDWQVHVYGDAEPALLESCAAGRLPLHVFAWSGASAGAGFERGAAYLIRPDGYVAVAAANGGAQALHAYMGRLSLRL